MQTTPTTPTTPPVAKKVPKTFEKFGDKRVDDYFWLRDKSDPAVVDYLKAENTYLDSVIGHLKPFQETLYKDMLSRIQETDDSVPYFMRGFWYVTKTETGKQYSIFTRRKGAMDAKDEVLLDGNELAKGKAFMSIGSMSVSPDNKWLAYSVDFTGFRQYTLQFKNLETGEVLADKIDRVTSVAWANDNKTIFYVTEDATTKRSNQLYRHTLGAKADTLIFEEKDELYNVGVDSTRSRAYIILTSESSETTEQRILDANKPDSAFAVYAKRKDNIKYFVDHHDAKFLVVTNDTGRNSRLVSAPISMKADTKNWKEIIPHRKDVKLDGVDVFKDYFVAVEKKGGLPQLRVFDMKTMTPHDIAFPEAAYDATPGQNPEFDNKLYRFNYGSLVTPNSVFDYDVAKRERTLKKQQPVLGGYKAEDYQVERIMATGKDGVKVPISLVYKKSLRKPGVAQPTLLYAYGSYGITLPLAFRSSRLALLDRGMIYAIAHIRGGGDMGKQWHDDGKMMKKINTFTDFVSTAEHLIQQKYTAPSMLAIQGGSAGGLLMGAVTNLRPELFKAVVSQVPFVDVMNTMLDATLPLTVGEYLEWGNPNQEKAYKYMRSYSPYDNLKRGAYPAMLVETSLNDSQVMYWEPAKYVAKLRTLKTDKNPLLLRTNLDAGHGGASGRYDYLKEIAATYSFVLSQLGINK
ncbi:MAG: S9 family peptidase [Aeromicrobium sp.]|nr:S9 family peptidase [Burkholderiales bacterium]